MLTVRNARGPLNAWQFSTQGWLARATGSSLCCESRLTSVARVRVRQGPRIRSSGGGPVGDSRNAGPACGTAQDVTLVLVANRRPDTEGSARAGRQLGESQGSRTSPPTKDEK